MATCTCIDDYKMRGRADPDCQACDMGIEIIDTFRAMRAALLAKSDAYDALVAEIAKAPVGVVRGARVNASNEILEVALCGGRHQVAMLSRVRLLPDPSPAQRGEED